MKSLLWIDVETTGLHPENGLLLEVGAILTDEKLEEIGSTTQVIGHGRMSKKKLIEYMDPYVKRMHTENRLIDEVYYNRITVEEAEIVLLKRIMSWKECWRAVPIAGSTPSFDRVWLNYHMPTLSRLFTHQHFDVSTLRMFTHLPKIEAEGSHRSLSDLRRDIAQVRAVL